MGTTKTRGATGFGAVSIDATVAPRHILIDPTAEGTIMHMTKNTAPTLWRRITAIAIGAGAITVGAVALHTPLANAATVKEVCQTNPRAYDDGATRGVFYTTRSGNDLVENCKLYGANGKLRGTYSAYVYGYFNKPGAPLPGPLPAQR